MLDADASDAGHDFRVVGIPAHAVYADGHGEPATDIGVAQVALIGVLELDSDAAGAQKQQTVGPVAAFAGLTAAACRLVRAAQDAANLAFGTPLGLRLASE